MTRPSMQLGEIKTCCTRTLLRSRRTGWTMEHAWSCVLPLLRPGGDGVAAGGPWREDRRGHTQARTAHGDGLVLPQAAAERDKSWIPGADLGTGQGRDVGWAGPPPREAKTRRVDSTGAAVSMLERSGRAEPEVRWRHMGVLIVLDVCTRF